MRPYQTDVAGKKALEVDATPYRKVALIALTLQGWVYVVTGLWPILHLPSFERVTGEKYDDFLVHTVGLLLCVVGAVVLNAIRRQRLTPDLMWLAAGSALSLLSIDVVYFANGRLPPVYLADAVMEGGFAVAALIGMRRTARS